MVEGIYRQLFCRLIAELFLGCKERGAESLADR
jgi:hypothetical protein